MTARRRRASPEAQIQRAVFQHLRARAAPGVLLSILQMVVIASRSIMKGLGGVPGVPDVIAIHQGRCFALELKAPGGHPTDKQLATIAALEMAGAFTAIAEGLDRALACLEAWGLLRGPAS
jgi:hypothetical protein